MNTKKLVRKFNVKADEWLADLRLMDDNAIQIKPNEKSWSVAELYDHVMRVGRTYQIPNLKLSISDSARRNKNKNKYGIAVFNLGLRKKVKIKMEKFPKPLVENFTPIQRNKNELVDDFLAFIKEVNALQEIVDQSSRTHKHYHPMFGDINTKEWFALIELHLWHHDKQKKSIKNYVGQEKLYA